VDFKNTLLIMTSNVGSSVIEKGGGQLGFQLDVDQVLMRMLNTLPHCPALLRLHNCWLPAAVAHYLVNLLYRRTAATTGSRRW
jgi:hypothetical protein